MNFDTPKPCLIPTSADIPGSISAFKQEYKLSRLNSVAVPANKANDQVTLWT